MAARTRSGTRLRVALFLAVGFAATGIGLVAYGTNVFRDLDLESVDARFTIRGTEAAPDDIVIVKVDDKTFSDLRRRWEEFRPQHAELIRRLKADGAKVIAYDVQFTEASLNPADDDKLITAVGDAGNVVLATTEVGPNGETGVFGGDDVVREHRARVGNANFPPDPGGYDRRMRYEVDKLKTFAVVTVERASGKPVKPFGTTWIDFHGPVDTFSTVSFSDAVLGKTKPGFFRGKIVVVGPWASTFQDLHPVSAGNDLMPGPEIQANAISTVLRGNPLNTVPAWVDVVLIVVFGLLAPLSGLRFALKGTLLISIAAAIGYLLATQLAFNQGKIVSFVYPFGTLVLASIGALGAHYLLAAFERERVRDVFSRFVPEAVVEQVLARTDSDLRLGGISLESTVMFSDLRGFTTFSESLPPARVIECLNVYLEEMTEAILAHGGTLVSYEGDGIMAVFGAPIEQLDHADRALAASREMLTERLAKFNAYLREQELSDGFKMGIGLNTGMVVSGNVGSERRLEYAAIGDTTNTASRLQGMTKGQSHLLFFSDMTRERLQREVDDIVFIAELEVRGRSQPVKIWSIEAASDAAFEERRARGYAPGALAK
jgi:adenylate cyclase